MPTRGLVGRLRTTGRELLRHAWVLPRIPLARAGLTLEPSFIIIGAQKAGTTSLFRYLSQHPDVRPPALKEIHFFDLYWSRGAHWYRAHFPLGRSPASMTGEASPYYLFHPMAPRRLVDTLPGARVIALLRNPVDRALSHYQWEVRYGNEPASFSRALEREERLLPAEAERLESVPGYVSSFHRWGSYLARGRYAEQLRRWLQWIDEDRLLVLRSEDFFRDTATHFARVLDFLELPATDAAAFATHNPGRYEVDVDVPRERLVEYFRPHNRELADLVDFDPSEWNEDATDGAGARVVEPDDREPDQGEPS